MQRAERRDAEQVRGPVLVGLAMTFTNVCAYVFVVAAIRWLSPTEYGQVGAMMALLLVTGVVQMGLQASAARAAATAHLPLSQVREATIRSGLRAAAILLVGGFCVSPLLAWMLGISQWLTIAFTVAAAAQLAVIGAVAGLLQGERRWYAFARVQVLAGLGRLLVATVVISAWPTATGATLGVALGALLPLAAAAWFVRRRPADTRAHSDADTNTDADTDAGSEAPVGAGLGLWTVLRDSHLLLALLVLSNLDVLMTRVIMDDHTSGLYAAGLTVTKAVLFLPQFVITVAFPDMVNSRSRRALQITLTTVVAIGLLTTAAVAVLGPVALAFIGGADYADVESRLWMFALLGTALSLVNVYVFRFLATARRGVEWWVWAAVATAVAGGFVVQTVTGLLTLMLVVDLVLLGCLAVLERRDGAPEPDGPLSAQPRARTNPDPH